MRSNLGRNVTSVFALAASGVLLLGSTTAWAQTPAPSQVANAAQESEVVIVTARKRGNEVLQDIGGSIQVIGGASLAEKAGVGFDDYARSVPGLNANNSGAGQTQLAFRGATSTRLNHANPNVPETAGVYLDETAVTTSGFNPDAGLVDIARIEVLRGPQGTLFGASAMSGVLRVIPREPNFNETTFDAGSTVFATENGAPSYLGDLTLNVPLSDNFALRGSAYGLLRGGFIDNVYVGPANSGREDYNKEAIFGGRLTAMWRPSETLKIKLAGTFQQTNADGRPDEYRANDPLTGLGLNSRTSNGGRILFPGESVKITEELQVAKFVDETFDDSLSVVALTIERDFGDITLTSVSSLLNREFENLLDDTYRSRDWINQANFNWFDIDRNGSPTFTAGTGRPGILNVGSDPLSPTAAVPLLRSPFENNTQLDRISQEVRIASEFDGNFNFIAGLYYEDESRDFQQNLVIPGLDAWLRSYCSFCSIPAYGATLPNNFFEGRYSFNTTQIAAFGEASFKAGKFELTLGGRYFSYKQDADVFFGGFIEFSEDRLVDSIEESGFSPKVELTYKPNDDLTLYGTYSEGFRLGSVQQFISSACSGDLRNLGVIGANQGPEAIPTTIGSDSLSNAEAGFKATLFGGRGYVNASAYAIDWKDARSQVFLGCGWILEGNFIDIQSRGLEFDFGTRVTDNLSVNFNFGLTNSEVSSVKEKARAVASVGDRTPMTPELTASIGFDYERKSALLNKYDLILRGDVSYVGDMVSDLGTAAEQANQGFIGNIDVPSNTVANLYLGTGTDDWTATLFIRNLTDEKVITGVDIDRRGPAAYSRGRPRNIGISVRLKM